MISLPIIFPEVLELPTDTPDILGESSSIFAKAGCWSVVSVASVGQQPNGGRVFVYLIVYFPYFRKGLSLEV
jgi:hypothetical protein